MGKLALYGGKPVRDEYLAYGRQWIDEADIEAVVEVLKGDYLTTGSTVDRFEKLVADYVGAKYAVAVSNGTAALHMACYAAGLKEGDEVLVSPLTFVASINCILYQGAKPVFVDINPVTYNMDVRKIEDCITDKTRAIIPVDFSGISVEMDEIKDIAQKYNLLIIEDAAHAFGSEYKGQKVGNNADMTEFSFHPVKPITTGEGGMITTNNYDLYKRMLMFRSHGITRDENLMIDNHGPWYYEQLELGYNYRITDIQCAIGITQLDKIEAFIDRRRTLVSKYNQAFNAFRELTLPNEPIYSKSGWHLYIIRLNLEYLKVDRKTIFEALKAENIGVNVHYIPVYYQPYYQKLGYIKGICPIAEEVYEEIITLPLFPKMSDKDIEDVIDAVKKVIKYFEKPFDDCK